LKIAYLDCAFGAVPAALFGALLDAGAEADKLEPSLRSLGLGRWKLRLERADGSGLEGLRPVFDFQGEMPRLRLPSQIRSAISRSKLPARAKRRSLAAYAALAKAEARVHRVPLKDVHFHEVGRASSILAVTGASAALEALGAGRVYSSPLPWCRGTVKTEHGVLSLPAPATLELLRGLPVSPAAMPGELVTPSGAAWVRTVAEDFGPPPAFTPLEAGLGAASGPARCRVILGEQHVRRSR
jgi:pyridinium-3,5-bisthiocarboxylic acid mononucleotide nickel chelatase